MTINMTAEGEHLEQIGAAAIYLREEGGLAEMIEMAMQAFKSGAPKVQMDSVVAVALCSLAAGELLKDRTGKEIVN